MKPDDSDQLDRRLTVILAADAAGYSGFAASDEEAAVRALGARRVLLDAAIAEHHGRIANTAGDSVLAEFASPVEAVRAAIAAQDAIEALNDDLPSPARMSFRVGVNLGDVIARGGDLLGDGVNVAARLQQGCPPGGVWISAKVADELRGKLAVALAPRGGLAFKNLPAPVAVFEARAGVGPAAPARARRRALIAAAAAALAIAVAAPLAWLALPGPSAVAPPADGGAAGPPTVAVLPFDNRSADPAQAYFADGVTDDVIAALGRFPQLVVLSRQAVLPYRARPPEDAARGLGARYVVAGSVQKAGERVRVKASLVDAARGGRQLWADDFDERLEDVFALQQRLAREVASHLSQSIQRVEQERALARPTSNLDAYDAVLRGRAAAAVASRAANRAARELFQRAIDLDPRYAGAWAALGNALCDQIDFGWTEFPDETLTRAERIAGTALAANPDDVESRALLSRVLVIRGRYDQAIAESDRALRLNPSDAAAHAARGGALTWSGRIPDAIEAWRSAHRVNPALSPGRLFGFGLALYLDRQHAECVALLEESIARSPTQSPFVHVLGAACYAQLGDDANARRAAATVRRLQPVLDIDEFGSRLRDPAQRAYLRDGLAKAGF